MVTKAEIEEKIKDGKKSLTREWMEMGLRMNIPKGQLKTFIKAKNKELYEEGAGRSFADWLADEAAEYAIEKAETIAKKIEEEIVVEEPEIIDLEVKDK